MGRNTLERGGISRLDSQGKHGGKMDGVGFSRAPLLGQYFSIRDTGILGYPHKRRVAGDKRSDVVPYMGTEDS